jgi:hypothetical protein
MDPVCFEQCGFTRDVLGDITTSATFTLNQQSTTTTSSTTPATSSSPPAGTAVNVPSSVGKLTGFTAKFRILNKFDPHGTTFRKNWNAAVKKDTSYVTLANSLMQSNGTISRAIFQAEDPGLVAEGAVLISDVLNRPDNLAADYDSYAAQTYDNAKLGSQDLATYLQNYSKLAADWQNIRAEGIGTLATIQYSFARPMNQPETHTVTGILSYAPHKTQLLTGNKVGAQIGISYDFSFLSNVLNPLSK